MIVRKNVDLNSIHPANGEGFRIKQGFKYL